MLFDLGYTICDIGRVQDSAGSIQGVLFKCALTERSDFLIFSYMTYIVFKFAKYDSRFTKYKFQYSKFRIEYSKF